MVIFILSSISVEAESYFKHTESEEPPLPEDDPSDDDFSDGKIDLFL